MTTPIKNADADQARTTLDLAKALEAALEEKLDSMNIDPRDFASFAAAACGIVAGRHIGSMMALGLVEDNGRARRQCREMIGANFNEGLLIGKRAVAAAMSDNALTVN